MKVSNTILIFKSFGTILFLTFKEFGNFGGNIQNHKKNYLVLAVFEPLIGFKPTK